MQVFQIVVAVIIIGLLATILVICSRKILPRCCPCFKKVIMLIKGKLMFNSLLRALLQTFLLTSISMWSAFQSIDSRTLQGFIDFLVAVLIFSFAVAFPVIV